MDRIIESSGKKLFSFLMKEQMEFLQEIEQEMEKREDMEEEYELEEGEIQE